MALFGNPLKMGDWGNAPLVRLPILFCDKGFTDLRQGNHPFDAIVCLAFKNQLEYTADKPPLSVED